MDSIIKQYNARQFEELSWCQKEGIMYQTDMSRSVDYGEDYFNKYCNYEETQIAQRLNQGRTSITGRYCNSILDIGIGSGEFIKNCKIRAYGYDINPLGIQWLKDKDLYINPYESMPNVDGLCFWDSLEHIPDPNALLSKIKSGQYVFISIPIFDDLGKIKQSKHYRPDEHYYYFTKDGMIKYMTDSNFKILDVSDFEILAGREGIYTFVFRKI